MQPWLDRTRLPDLDQQQAHKIRELVEHPHAPVLRNRSGHHLNAADLQQLHWYTHRYGRQQDWLTNFLAHCQQLVPFYRQYRWANKSFAQLPTIDRALLSQDITAFVPDDLPLERLICYETSGTSGHALKIPSHPQVAARYHLFHQQALAWHGIDKQQFSSDVAVVLAGYQQRCFTYISTLPYWDRRLLLKLNFHPNDWRDAADRGKYLEHLAPDIITGDPLSLSQLAELEFAHQPKALMSTSMTLLPALKAALQQRFSAPVIDIYSMNEAGPIAADDGSGLGLRLLQQQLLVEIVDAHGQCLPDGERGEICITGGFNDYLPLLRYRTGDYACLYQDAQGRRYLQQFEGRAPVRYRNQQGKWLNNVDITHLLAPFALSQYQFHQYADGRVRLAVRGRADEAALRLALSQEFAPAFIEVQNEQHFGDKVLQYSSDLAAAWVVA